MSIGLRGVSSFGFDYEVLYESRRSRARVGVIRTSNGLIETPAFVPVATTGALKCVDLALASREVLEMGMVFVNTYHLMVHPGVDLVKRAGGLHAFIGYDGPLITDSGGYQVFSMASTGPQDELKGKSVSKWRNPCAGGANRGLVLKIDEEGVTFRSYRNGELLELTPEISVKAQKSIGANIILPLDILLPNSADFETLIDCFHRTHRWESRSLEEHLKDQGHQVMYAIIHGGTDVRLREASLEYLSRRPFQGFAIGGSLGKNRLEMYDLLSHLCPKIPRSLPVHLLGIGDVPSILRGVELGIDTFDSAYPTRAGRHGSWLTADGSFVNLKGQSFAERVQSPPVDLCDCPVCRCHSGAYVHHLYKAKEPVASQLGSIHNLYRMTRLMKEIRERILSGAM
ncbi:queuine tRNA-ribosyltransferase-like isoform X2 [Schistocerca gregaria]|uniref:queuine tRNA-ribosyltransferase-like isoform X2 n=1 Tax=Schistocerca gregaria TaxID=7010 RepID=UPI00211EE238|nr:queuine tRNA-ribosyltransferase-like isoform X2 [Schistocerca gregaria]